MRHQFSLASLLEFVLALGAILSSIAAVAHEMPAGATWIRPVTFLVTWLVLLGVYLRRGYFVALAGQVLIPASSVLFGITSRVLRGEFETPEEVRAEAWLAFAVSCFVASCVTSPLILLGLLGVRDVRDR